MNNQSWISANIKSVLAVIVVVLGISYFFMCSIRDIKPDPQILIAMVSSMGIVLGYFFGSSTKTSDAGNPTITGDKPNVVVNNPTPPNPVQ